MSYVLITTNKGEIIRLSVYDIELSEFTWVKDARGYVAGRYKGTLVRLHRLVAERMLGASIPTGMVVDHIDGHVLNCHRDNLRIATHRQNTQNRKPHKNSRTGYKGIQTNGFSWYASIMHNGERIYSGSYKTPLEAAKEYDKMARTYFGEYARTNGV